jgi:asparagine synthase (glutamine-hydrolysing)
MSDVVMATWTPWREPPLLVGRCQAAAGAAGWTTALEDPGLWIATPAVRPVTARLLPPGRLVVAGELFPSQGDRAEPLRSDSALAWGEWLTGARWGRYLALIRSSSGLAEAVLRDPSGAREALLWTQDGVTFFSSALPDWLLESARPGFRLDWNAVGGFLADPLSLLGPGALHGLTLPAPGDLHSLDPGAAPVSLWRPAWAAGEIRAEADAGEALRRTLDACIGTLLSGERTWLVEVSGGLDSAFVAGSAAAAAPGRIRSGFNLFSGSVEGDERGYAEAVAARCGLQLTTALRTPAPFDLDALAERSGGARPALGAFDLPYDRALAACSADLGADGVVTGQGGDAVLFEAPHAGVFADEWRARGLGAVRDGMLAAVARWTRRSAWSVLAEAVAGAKPRRRPPCSRLRRC